MIKHFLLLSLMIISLFANDNFLSDKVLTKVEAGYFSPMIVGNIKNFDGESDFKKDFGYGGASATYLSVEVLLDYDYVPNFDISYFNMQTDESATLDRSITVADGTFNSDVATIIDYQILTATLFQDFMIKGKYLSLFGSSYYSGDLEFDIGMSTKAVAWNFEVTDVTKPASNPSSWIHVKQLIVLPYFGMKYYLYDFLLHANVNALSFSEAKSLSYEVSVDYRIVGGVYVSVGYLHEEFKAVEKLDSIEFGTSGYKISFKYAF